MHRLLKNLFSLILPVTVLVLVPRWIENDWTLQNYIQLIAGGLIMTIGLCIMSVCILDFIRVGKGTLAPWSPPENLVVTGLYRYVRNPMILGVLTVLLGEACFFGSTSLLVWAGLFFTINTTYFFVFEEPQLERRFGDDYRTYAKHVNRWIPRLTPFQPKS